MEKEIVSTDILEKHQTKDTKDSHINGSLTVVWRDWDNKIKNDPKMVYVSSVNPGEIKGPHLHKKRTSYCTCIHGKVVFIIQDKDGTFREIESNSEDPILICIPNGVVSAHINITNEVSSVLVLADKAWKPDDNEMENVKFEKYDWAKWNL